MLWQLFPIINLFWVILLGELCINYRTDSIWFDLTERKNVQ